MVACSKTQYVFEKRAAKSSKVTRRIYFKPFVDFTVSFLFKTNAARCAILASSRKYPAAFIKRRAE